jgi:exodeoxyribonuclease-3
VRPAHVKNHKLPGLSKTLIEIGLKAAAGPIALFATHFGSRNDPFQPADEADVVLSALAAVGASHLLAGDVNALHPTDRPGPPPEGTSLRRVEQGADSQRGALATFLGAKYVDCYRAKNPGHSGYTFRTSHPWLRLDYLLASPGLAARLSAAGVVTGTPAAEASDHFPVWAEFEV